MSVSVVCHVRVGASRVCVGIGCRRRRVCRAWVATSRRAPGARRADHTYITLDKIDSAQLAIADSARARARTRTSCSITRAHKRASTRPHSTAESHTTHTNKLGGGNRKIERAPRALPLPL
eukprot:scaffold23232_cov131-Isochrysis_galbana.AAC.7